MSQNWPSCFDHASLLFFPFKKSIGVFFLNRVFFSSKFLKSVSCDLYWSKQKWISSFFACMAFIFFVRQLNSTNQQHWFGACSILSSWNLLQNKNVKLDSNLWRGDITPVILFKHLHYFNKTTKLIKILIYIRITGMIVHILIDRFCKRAPIRCIVCVPNFWIVF